MYVCNITYVFTESLSFSHMPTITILTKKNPNANQTKPKKTPNQTNKQTNKP